MNEVQRNTFPIRGLMSFILSLSFAFVCLLMYSMMIVGFLPFASFEFISFVFIAIPLTVGIIGVRREARKALSIFGIVISSLAVVCLLLILATNGM